MALLWQNHRWQLPRKVPLVFSDLKWLDCKYRPHLTRGNKRMKRDYITGMHPLFLRNNSDYLFLMLSCSLSPHHHGRFRDSLRTPVHCFKDFLGVQTEDTTGKNLLYKTLCFIKTFSKSYSKSPSSRNSCHCFLF